MIFPVNSVSTIKSRSNQNIAESYTEYAVRNLRYVYLNFEVVFFGTLGIFHKERKLMFLNSF